MMPNKEIIAIIGGIGCGKTQVCNYLRRLGLEVLSADDVSREIANDNEVIERVATVFGSQYVVDNQINRKLLRKYVFANKARVEQLNEIFLAKIVILLKQKIESIAEAVVFVEVTNYSTLLDDVFTQKWLMQSSENNRIKRIVFRDNVKIKQALDVMNIQNVPSDADEIINNNASIENLYNTVDELLDKHHFVHA